MHYFLTTLAYAERSEPASAQIPTILGYIAAVGGAGVAACVPLVIARRRGFGRMDGLVAVMMFWGLAAAGSVIWTLTVRARWSGEYLRRIASGYFDPKDVSDAPGWPWPIWILLGAAYVGFVIFAFTRRSDGAGGNGAG